LSSSNDGASLAKSVDLKTFICGEIIKIKDKDVLVKPYADHIALTLEGLSLALEKNKLVLDEKLLKQLEEIKASINKEYLDAQALVKKHPILTRQEKIHATFEEIVFNPFFKAIETFKDKEALSKDKVFLESFIQHMREIKLPQHPKNPQELSEAFKKHADEYLSKMPKNTLIENLNRWISAFLRRVFYAFDCIISTILFRKNTMAETSTPFVPKLCGRDHFFVRGWKEEVSNARQTLNTTTAAFEQTMSTPKQ
jgi:hypothetical protein